MQAENQVLSDIIKSLFPKIKQHETDVPKDFKRPCFLFINPDSSTETQELTKTTYKETKTLTFFCFDKGGKDVGDGENEAVADKLLVKKNRVLDYLMGVKKIQIPGEDRRYFTMESVSARTDDVNSVIEFTVRLSRMRQRNLRRPETNKIKGVVNRVKIE